MIRPIKKYTIKEWNKLSSIQEVLCKKFEIILTDHKTKRQKIFSILNTINFKNINRGIEIFNESIQNFGNSMDQLTRELNQTSQNNIKIWSDEENNSKDKENLEKIWGKRKWDVKFVKFHIRIQVNSHHGKSKFVDIAV